MADPFTITSTAASVVPVVETSIIARIEPHIKRALNANRNLDDLKSRVDFLKSEKEKVQALVDEARDGQGREIHRHVQDWLTNKVEPWTGDDTFTEDEGKAKQRCFIGLCPNYITRYRISVKVEEGAKEVTELLEEAAKYDAVEKISRRPPALATRVMSIKNYEAAQSRTSVIKQIVDALASSGKNLIGLYGMGGVGKTTLVKVIAKQVLEEELFDKVVIGTITENPNVEAIQEEIAESLGLRFEEKSERVRASRLHDKLEQEQKILVILDDLWGRIDLEAIGIPFPDQQKGLKILMTSRDEHVLSRQMGAEETFQLQVLIPGEAWDLFQKMVGDVKDPSVRSIAKQVATRCAGLPVLLATVARALRRADLNDWKDALNQLPRLKDNKFAEQVYPALELSYKYLGSDDAKSLFLLCGQLGPPEIPLAYLLKCGRGLGLFESSSTLEEARIRLSKLVKDLKASCLLVDGDREGFVRMHEIVHNFAALISSRDRPVFKVTPGSELRWPSDDTLRQCIAIILPYCKIPDFPVTLDCPKLELLQLYCQNSSVQFPDNLFIRMKESLKVLDLRGFHFPRLPLSIQFLENLQTLCFDWCTLEDLHIIGELKKLQVLSFCGSDIVELPREIGQLAHLQSLDLTHCRRLAVIPPDVLSCLTKLEDLYMGNVVLQWDVEEQSGRKNASLAELKHLQKLVTLVVHITDAKMLPKGLFFEKLEWFRIFIGEGWNWFGKYETSRTLKLKLNTSTPLADGLKLLLNKSEDLYLQGAEGVGDVLKVLEVQGSSHLKHLNVHNSLDIEFLANSTGMGQPHAVFPSLKTLFLYNLNSLKKICHGQIIDGSFGNLSVLKVGNCDKLKYLISLSMARGLLLLEEIKIFNCKIMEKIVVQEGEDDANKDEQIEWTQLRSLTLQDLPQLESFCSELKGPSVQETNQMPSPTGGKCNDVHEDEAETTLQPHTKKTCFPQLISFCSLSKTRNKELANNSRTDDIVHGTPVPLTYRKVKIVFPALEELNLSSLKMENLCDSRLVHLSSCSKTLTSLLVRGCDNLRSLFTYSMVKSLGQLRKLEICDCKLLEEVIVIDEGFGKGDMESKTLFPQLDFLKVKGLQHLVRFCLSNLFIFSSLKTLWVESCPKLKTFVSSPTKTADMTSNMETEVADSALFDQKVAFPELEELRIVHMDALRKIWHDQLHEDSFGKLKTLKVEHAAELQNVFPSKTESRFQSLENLLITDCDSLIELFDMSPMVVAQLKTLHTRGLPSLKSLFPVSIATMQLCLEEIDVVNCGIEEIITKQEGIELGGVPVFRFPRLTFLALWNLSKLKGFYSRRHVSEWPMLKRLITNYDKMPLFDWESQRFEEASYLEIQPFFSAQKVIPNLEQLTLNGKDVEIICGRQVSADLFCKVNILRLQGFLDKPIAFLVGLLQRYFYSLKCLYVESGCFKEMASPDEQIFIGNQGTTFTQMRFLSLNLIYNLKHLSKQDSQLDCLLKNLETLLVWQCRGLTNLSLLSSSFQTLINLDVYCCHGLVNIFTPLMAKWLVQLTEISIRECKMVREVVANEGDDTEDEIIFSKVETLKFSCLPRLTSFCLGSCRMKFQSLVKVIVRQCPKMRTFSNGATSTPKLQKVQLTENEDKSHWMGDLNATIQQLYNEQVGFRGLKNLKLSEYPELKDVWHNDLPVEVFSDLTSLVVDDCPFFSHAISPALLPVLKDLEKLEVKNCHSLEGLFDLEKLNADEENSKLLPGLRELRFTNLAMLERLWSKDSQAIFKLKNLCVLKVDNCSSLRNIFTESVAVGLEKLKTIEIRNCAMMEAILTADSEEASVGKIVIPALESLVLGSLPNLTSVYSGSGILELPSLKEITIDCCPKMKAFVSSTLRVKQPRIVDEVTEETLFEGDADDAAALLFDDKIVFPKLEELELKFINMKTLWDGPFEAVKSSFLNLRRLSVEKCDRLKYLFTSSMVGCLVQLEYLSVRGCAEIEEIIQTEEVLLGEEWRIGKNEIVFSKLDALYLGELPKLKRFCSGYLIKCPHLKKIDLCSCNALKTFVFNPSSCENKADNAEQEHDEEDSAEKHQANARPLFDEKVYFPSLAELEINGMVNLEKIWHDQLCDGSFCTLRKMDIVGCKQLLNVFPSNIWRKFTKLEQLKITRCYALEEIFDLHWPNVDGRRDVVDCQLRDIYLYGLHNLRHIWNQDPLQEMLTTFRNLQSVTASDCPFLKSLFPTSIARDLMQLETLTIRDCARVEEIVAMEESVRDNLCFRFPNLSSLVLRELPKLKNFYPGMHTSEWPVLKELVVDKCYAVELLFSEFPILKQVDGDGQPENQIQQPFLCRSRDIQLEKGSTNFEKLTVWQGEVIISATKSREVWYCDSLFSLGPPSACFQSLTTLKVHSCDGLTYIMAPSTAKSLVQLKELSVHDCTRVSEIVAKQDEKTKDDGEITFSKLECLMLVGLKALTNFSSGGYTFIFPNLEKVIVQGCHSMSFFSSGHSRTPKLEGVRWREKDRRREEDKSKVEWKGDLNSTIQHLFKEMVAFDGIEELKLSEFPEMREIWHGQLKAELFQDLRSLMVDECQISSIAVPSNLLPCLNDLEELEVRNCNSLKVIFDLENLKDDERGDERVSPDGNEGDDKMLLPTLRKLCLTDLPRLSHIYNKQPRGILKFKNLSILRIDNCSSLKNMFGPSMVLGLEGLKEMEIRNCSAMEEIISTSEIGEEAAIGTVRFPALEKIVLESLPNLTGIYSGSGVLEFSSLKGITIASCPKMNAFLSSTSRKQEAKRSDEDKDKGDIGFPPTASFLNDKVVFSCLEMLGVDCNNTIWMEEIANGQAAPEFCNKIKVLEFMHSSNDCFVFPSQFLQRFPNLDTVIVRDALFEQIVLHEETSSKEKQAGVFTQLKRLKLSRLPKLKHLSDESQTWLCFQNVKKLMVLECGGLKILASSLVSFRCLTVLVVTKCHGLIHLVASSTVKFMVQLRVMWISKCKMIQEIVANEENDPGGEFNFSSLECLILDGLPSLTSFCSGKYAFTFPILEAVIVNDCPKLRTFSQGVSNTPKLKKLYFEAKEGAMEEGFDNFCENYFNKDVEEEEEGEESEDDADDCVCWWKGSLNATVRELYREMGQSEPTDSPSEQILDSETTRAENESSFGLIEAVASEDLSVMKCKELEVESTVKLTIREQDTPQVASRYQKSDATSKNALVTDRADSESESDNVPLVRKSRASTESLASASQKLDKEESTTPEAQIGPSFMAHKPALGETEQLGHCEQVVSSASATKSYLTQDTSICDKTTASFPAEASLATELRTLGEEGFHPTHAIDSLAANTPHGSAVYSAEIEVPPDGQEVAQDNLAASSKQLTSNLDASQDQAVPQDKLPFSSKQPTSNFEAAEAEKNSPPSASEEPALEDLCATENSGSKKDLHQEIDTTSEVIIEEQARKATLKTPETAQNLSTDSAILYDKQDRTPGQRILEIQETNGSLPVQMDRQATTNNEPRKHQAIAPPVSAPTAEQALLSISEHPSKPTSFQELICSADNSTSEASSLSVVKTSSHSPADFESLFARLEKLSHSNPATTFHSASSSNALPESIESSDHARSDSCSDSVAMLQNVLEKALAEVYGGLLSQACLENLKRPLSFCAQEIDRTVIEFSIDDKKKGIAELKTLCEYSMTEISTLDAEKEALLKKVKEIEEQKNHAQAKIEDLYDMLVERIGELEKDLDALRKAARQ